MKKLYVTTNAGGQVTGRGGSTDGTLPAGAVVVTADQYTAAAAGGTVVAGAYVAPAAAVLAGQQAQQMIAAGLAITSTGTPALNATYPCTQFARRRYHTLQLAIGGGAANVRVVDVTGVWHVLDASHVTALLGAIGVFCAGCEAVIDGAPGAALPAAAATIA